MNAKDTPTLTSILTWFQTAVPHPSRDNFRVQSGCHLEEVGEMLQVMFDPLDPLTLDTVEAADEMKAGKLHPRYPGELTDSEKADLLDALCDQIVTAIGIAHMARFNIIGALNAVDQANWAKFPGGKPQFDRNGKVEKPEGWEPANVVPFTKL